MLQRSAKRPNTPLAHFAYLAYLAGGVGLFGQFVILRSEANVMDE